METSVTFNDARNESVMVTGSGKRSLRTDVYSEVEDVPENGGATKKYLMQQSGAVPTFETVDATAATGNPYSILAFDGASVVDDIDFGATSGRPLVAMGATTKPAFLDEATVLRFGAGGVDGSGTLACGAMTASSVTSTGTVEAKSTSGESITTLGGIRSVGTIYTAATGGGSFVSNYGIRANRATAPESGRGGISAAGKLDPAWDYNVTAMSSTMFCDGLFMGRSMVLKAGTTDNEGKTLPDPLNTFRTDPGIKVDIGYLGGGGTNIDLWDRTYCKKSLNVANGDGLTSGAFSVSSGGATITGPIELKGAVNAGTNALTCGALTPASLSLTGAFSCGDFKASSVDSSGTMSCGTNAMSCGALTASGAFSCGTHAATCGALTASGTFSCGTNAATCGALTANGAFSCGTNAATCGILTASGLVTGAGVAAATAAVAQDSKTSFLQLSSCAGAPYGNPTKNTGMVPMVFDSVNYRLCMHDNSTWLPISAGICLVTSLDDDAKTHTISWNNYANPASNEVGSSPAIKHIVLVLRTQVSSGGGWGALQSRYGSTTDTGSVYSGLYQVWRYDGTWSATSIGTGTSYANGVYSSTDVTTTVLLIPYFRRYDINGTTCYRSIWSLSKNQTFNIQNIIVYNRSSSTYPTDGIVLTFAASTRLQYTVYGF